MQHIAVLNPLGDYGINQYCHELAEGLGLNGASVSFFTGADCGLPPSSHHRRLPVLNSVLFKQRPALAGVAPSPATAIYSEPSVAVAPPNHSPLRKAFLTIELALYLKAQRYDVVWTHWPEMESYHPGFWRLCRRLGMYVVHTVHNVSPHDGSASLSLPAPYKHADLLVVHSAFARAELLSAYPQVAAKTIVCLHGAYSIYLRRPEARDRVRQQLGVAPDQPLILFCGAIRPYKNIDAVLHAMRDPRYSEAVLAVAGTEAGFADGVAGDSLGRTRRIARELGIEDRMRLMPRHLSISEMSELFEAGDIKVLPYLKGYGSGMLLLAMTFGKYIVSTRTGGADEYLESYPRATLLQGPSSEEVADGIAEAIARLDDPAPPASLSHLQWPAIARQALECIGKGQSQGIRYEMISTAAGSRRPRTAKPRSSVASTPPRAAAKLSK